MDNLLAPSLKLQNTLGEYTHYPRNGHSPSIVDLTFTRGYANTDVLNWTLGGNRGSDHLSTHIHITTERNIGTTDSDPSPQMA